MALPWPNTTKLPLGVTMVLVSQVPKWHGHGSGLTKPPSDYVALRRSRGVVMVRVRPCSQVMLWHYADQEGTDSYA